MITTILNCYKRVQYIEQQVQSIRNQTIPTEDIMIWYNKPENGDQYDLTSLGCKVVTCNYNFKFHGRFALGLLAKTEYVAFFDDDTLPEPRWFENCLDTINSGYDGILGASGVFLQKRDSYLPHSKVGWNGVNNDSVVEVDLVGHAWFMKKDYLRYLWYEEPLVWETGEDMQLSFLAQKHGDVKTYVPPHPKHDISGWGSTPMTGMKIGTDSSAASGGPSGKEAEKNRNLCVKMCCDNGWKLVNER